MCEKSEKEFEIRFEFKGEIKETLMFPCGYVKDVFAFDNMIHKKGVGSHYKPLELYSYLSSPDDNFCSQEDMYMVINFDEKRIELDEEQIEFGKKQMKVKSYKVNVDECIKELYDFLEKEAQEWRNTEADKQAKEEKKGKEEKKEKKEGEFCKKLSEEDEKKTRNRELSV